MILNKRKFKQDHVNCGRNILKDEGINNEKSCNQYYYTHLNRRQKIFLQLDDTEVMLDSQYPSNYQDVPIQAVQYLKKLKGIKSKAIGHAELKNIVNIEFLLVKYQTEEYSLTRMIKMLSQLNEYKLKLNLFRGNMIIAELKEAATKYMVLTCNKIHQVKRAVSILLSLMHTHYQYLPISNPLMKNLGDEWDLHHNTRVLGAILCLSSVLMEETKKRDTDSYKYSIYESLFEKIIDFYSQILKKIICYEQEYMTKTHLSYLYNRNWLLEKKREIQNILQIEYKKHKEWVATSSTKVDISL